MITLPPASRRRGIPRLSGRLARPWAAVPSTVHFHLKKLADAGVIGDRRRKGRAITLTHPAAPSVPEPEEPADRVPIVGNVAAGSPILAQECIEDYLTFHTGHPGDVHFALRVRGESMLNAGILPGDLVVVQQQRPAIRGRSWWP